MKTQAEQKKENKNQSVPNSVYQKHRDGKSTLQLVDNRPETLTQMKLQDTNSTVKNHSEPIQMSRGSSQANKELAKAMGKGASLVDQLPKAKPHTKKGTGRGGGTDHQGRNAMVINKAKRDTMKAHDDPTMFSASRMRGDARGKEKSAAAAEKRQKKVASIDTSMDDYEKAMVQATTTYKGSQEDFDNYLEKREFEFSDEQLDNLYEALLAE
ncbi:hypothetical protein FIA58_004415 [Flavobacterium jejuense]|uniref:Uncharacterized protein n=1 Tax=Flavobacterium jejuense TaxID=1544455 RepID=A0ABX0IM68_9FLAO|nr:hypothetical protein [Flavobacterium jejuense]NHN24914.1 hypothetical protein [Flavobacterium jejuense]